MQTVEIQTNEAASNEAAAVETVAAPVAPAKPAKRAKQAKQAAPAVKPAKPVQAAKQSQAADDKRAKLILGDRELAQRFYAGASLAVHSSKPRKLAEYIERARTPVQRANSESPRDASGLALILSRADKLGQFDPCAGSGVDLGIISRLASLKLIAVTADGSGLTLTGTGLSRARAIVRKAA